MTGWEPATEAEIAMRDALRAGDQEQYFRVLARMKLLLPVSADALAGRAPMGWGTWTTGGRTHVLAFTSTDALRACLAEHAGSARELPYLELAAGWPNLEWWLAVNPGLPIEGYLPAWFVAQLARGDVRLPGRQSADDPPGRAGAPARSPDDTPTGILPAPAAAGSGYGVNSGPLAPSQPGPVAATPPPVPAPVTASGLPRRPTNANAQGYAGSSGSPGPYAPPVSPGPGGAVGPDQGTGAPVRSGSLTPSSSDGRAGWPNPPASSGPYPPSGPPPQAYAPPPVPGTVPTPSYPPAPGSPVTGPPSSGALPQPVPRPESLPRRAGTSPASPLAAAPPPVLPESLPRRPGTLPRRPDPADSFGPQQPGQPPPYGFGHGQHPGLVTSGPAGAAPTPSSVPGPLPQRPTSAASGAGPAGYAPPSGAGPAVGMPQAAGAPLGAVASPLAPARPAYPPQTGPGLGGTPSTGPSAAGGPLAGPSSAAGGPLAGPSSAAGGPLAGPSSAAGGALAGPSSAGAAAAGVQPAAGAQTAAGPAFVPANEVEEALLTAAGDGSTDSFLSTLLLAKVLVPIPADASRSALPGDDDFAWRTENIDGERFVVVFTSAERLGEHVSEPIVTISVKFIQLIRAWPDPAWSFAVNPGTPVGATLPGAQILALATWAADVGLGAEGEDEGDPAEPTRDEPEAGERRPAPEDPNRPTVMQKVVQPDQVGYYLDRGYDRVSGFVHRAAEVAHLRTPEKLVMALGLRYTGSPFSANAAQVYLLRWPAYRPSLYRIPYGGQSEAAMRAMEGWVIERPPFRGNGFAPGDSGEVIAEFKVDSARLPHGAQLWCITADGAEKLVAVLDADRPVWRQVGED